VYFGKLHLDLAAKNGLLLLDPVRIVNI